MTLAQRCVNTAVLAASKALNHLHTGRWGPIGALARRHGLPPPGRSASGGVGGARPLLLLVNFDFALEPARPVAPSTRYVGALMPRAPAPLPEDLRAWLDGESGGDDGAAAALPVVYVSFGASFLAPEPVLASLAGAMAATRGRARFLLRLRAAEEAPLRRALAAQTAGSSGAAAAPFAAAELLVKERVPQNDVLAHPAVAAFVTQAGYLSVAEAAYHGVPIVGVPLTLGQGELARHAHDHGRGVLVDKRRLLRGDAAPLAAAIAAVAVERRAEFKRAAVAAAARLRAHPRSAAQRAADLVDYALALPRGDGSGGGEGGSFLHTQGQDMGWWQVVLLDVLALYTAAAVMAVWLLREAAAWATARLPRGAAAASTGRRQRQAIASPAPTSAARRTRSRSRTRISKHD